MKMSRSELPGHDDTTPVDIELPLGDAATTSSGVEAAAVDTDLAPLHSPRQAASPLGALLAASSALSKEDVDRILEYQKQHGLRFGEAAVQLQLVKPADVQRALARQFSYPYLISPPDPKTLSADLVAAYQPYAPATEYLRALRSQLLLHWHDPSKGKQILAIVGTRPGEGRSYLAANLAILFAQLGERTLLIDANLREPRQHDLFMLENRIGLSSALAGLSHEDASVGIAEMPGLFVLPAGPIPPNPVELLHGRLFDLLLRKARTSFGAVIIDTPSLSAGDDAQMVARRAGAALMVASSRHTRTREFSEAIQGLQRCAVDVVGSVLNEDTQRLGATR